MIANLIANLMEMPIFVGLLAFLLVMVPIYGIMFIHRNGM
jgi:hypothetical protein